MALLWLDGFEGYGTSVNTNIAVDLTRRYGYIIDAANYVLKAGRVTSSIAPTFSAYCSQADGVIHTPSLTTADTIIVGVAMLFQAGFIANGYDRMVINLFDGPTQGMNLVLRDDTLKVYRGGTLLATSSSTLGIAANVWHYFEFKVKCHASAGTYEVHLDGVAVSGLTATGQNTKAGDHTYHDSVRLNCGSFHIPFYDDFYVCDNSGSVNNSFMNPGRIIALWPNYDGDSKNFSTSSGSTHYTLVDDRPSDNDTTYVYSHNSGDQELYYFDTANIGGTIKGIQINLTCRVEDVKNVNCTLTTRRGNTTNDSGVKSIGTITYDDVFTVLQVNPDTGNAWTANEVSNTQFGVKVV